MMSFTNRIQKLLETKPKVRKPRPQEPQAQETSRGEEFGPEGQERQRSFSLAEVLTVTTGVLLVNPSEFGHVKGLVDYLLGDNCVRDLENLTTEQALELVGTGASACKDWIFEQCPALKDFTETPEESEINVWLAKIGRKVGETVVLSPKPISAVGWTDYPADIFWTNKKVQQ